LNQCHVGPGLASKVFLTPYGSLTVARESRTKFVKLRYYYILQRGLAGQQLWNSVDTAQRVPGWLLESREAHPHGAKGNRNGKGRTKTKVFDGFFHCNSSLPLLLMFRRFFFTWCEFLCPNTLSRFHVGEVHISTAFLDSDVTFGSWYALCGRISAGSRLSSLWVWAAGSVFCRRLLFSGHDPATVGKESESTLRKSYDRARPHHDNRERPGATNHRPRHRRFARLVIIIIV
jgi:hypothetical protein